MTGRSRRTFFQHGELALVVLALVGRRAMHGYELMNELGRLLRPTYEPSPGGVYPALAALVAEGLLVDDTEHDGRRRRYRITASGRAALRTRRAALRGFEVRTGVRLGGDDVREALDRFVARVTPIAEHLDPDAVEAILDRTATELEEARTHG